MKRAFTLMEILLVIAIIAVLAGFLFPVIAQGKEKGHETKALHQAQQLGMALAMYADQHDEKLLPSTNYGAPEASPARFWIPTIQALTEEPHLVVADGSDGKAPTTWAERGLPTFGYSSATAVDRSKGCSDETVDTTGCPAFRSAFDSSRMESPASTALLASTPGGPVAKGYRGYEFSPYNGITSTKKRELSAPLVSDRDLVRELVGLPAELMEPVMARYGATGHDEGRTPVVFADGHAKAFSAKQIAGESAGLIWRFR